jgi:hypothetical protein
MRGRDSVVPLAVFKPIDEEQFAPNNPRQFRGNFGDATFRKGVRSGEQTIRELAAFLLDHGGFSKVPPVQISEFGANLFSSSDSADH